MIEQFFWPKTDWQQPQSRESGKPSAQPGAGDARGGRHVVTSRTRAWGAASGAQNPLSCPFLGFPARPCVKASGEGKDPA